MHSGSHAYNNTKSRKKKKRSNTVRQKCNLRGEDPSEEQKTPLLEQIYGGNKRGKKKKIKLQDISDLYSQNTLLGY